MAYYVVRTIEPKMRFAEAPSEEAAPSIVSQETAQLQSEADTSVRYYEYQKLSQTPVDDAAISQPKVGAPSTFRAKEQPELTTKMEAPKYKSADMTESTSLAEIQRFEKKALPGARKMDTGKEPFTLQEQRPVARLAYEDRDERAKEEAKGLTPTSKALPAPKEHNIVFNLTVEQVEPARKAIEEILKQFEGKIIKTEPFDNRDVIVAEVDSEKLQQLKEQLSGIGEIKDMDEKESLEGKVRVKIRIVNK
jgi:hypothetical protein